MAVVFTVKMGGGGIGAAFSETANMSPGLDPLKKYVLRDVLVCVQAPIPGFDAYVEYFDAVNGFSTEILHMFFLGPGVPFDLIYQWQGRQVFDPGDQLNLRVITGTGELITWALTGYRFELEP